MRGHFHLFRQFSICQTADKIVRTNRGRKLPGPELADCSPKKSPPGGRLNSAVNTRECPKGSARLLTLVALVVLSIAINPYYFGVGDHDYKIPFVRVALNPALYSRDITVQMSRLYVSHFYLLVRPLEGIFGLELAYFIIYCGTQFLYFFSIQRLAVHLSPRADTGFLAVFLLLVPRRSFGGVATFDPIVEERCIALSIILYGLCQLLGRRTILAGALLGFAANLHFVAAANVLPFVAIYLATSRAEICWRAKLRKAVRFLGSFTLLAAPFLFTSALARSTNRVWWIDPDWLEIILWRSPHHFLPSYGLIFYHLTFGSLAAAMLYRLPGTRSSLELEARRIHLASMVAMILGTALATLFSLQLPLLPGLQLSLFRTDSLFLVLTLIMVVDILQRCLGGRSPLLLMAIVGIYFFDDARSVLVLLAAGIFAALDSKGTFSRIRGFFENNASARRISSATLIVLFSSIYLFSLCQRFRVASFNNPLKVANGSAEDFQLTIRNTLPENALVLAPPYSAEFRGISDRAILGTFKDLTYSVLDRPFSFEMYSRLSDLCGVAPDRCSGLGCEKLCRSNFWKLTPRRLTELARKYNVTHVILERARKLHPLEGFERIYASDRYVIERRCARNCPRLPAAQ
jgi:hypothetical protein